MLRPIQNPTQSQHWTWKKKIRRSLEKKPKEHNPPGDFAKKRVLKLVKFSGHCRAIKS